MFFATVILEYIMSVNPCLDALQVQNTLRNVLPVVFYPGTLAEKFYREGEAIGEARGEARGRLKTLQEFAGLPVQADTDLALLSDAEIEQKIQDVRRMARDPQS